VRVELVSSSATQKGGDLLDQIAHAARVSNPSTQKENKNVEGLIRYLIKHKHWSPFEMASICLEVETTRDIARQFLRHRSFSFQEFSQRYADPTVGFVFETREARLQDTKNRQNSIELDDSDTSDDLKIAWSKKQRLVAQAAYDAYSWAIQNGIAKEQARVVLPEGLMQSKLYVNGTVRSWIHYIELRTAPGTQKEHRILALRCANEIEKVFPMIKEFVDFEGLQEYNYLS
jgi:thymidylate synthase (FAD)